MTPFPKTLNPQERRQFIKTALLAAAAIPMAGALLSACTKNPSGGDPATTKLPDGAQPVKEEDPTAQALGYKINAQKVNTEAYPKRKGPEGEKQFCNNCSFYVVKNENWGDCQVLRGGVVNAAGWCNSWVASKACG